MRLGMVGSGAVNSTSGSGSSSSIGIWNLALQCGHFPAFPFRLEGPFSRCPFGHKKTNTLAGSAVPLPLPPLGGEFLMPLPEADPASGMAFSDGGFPPSSAIGSGISASPAAAAATSARVGMRKGTEHLGHFPPFPAIPSGAVSWCPLGQVNVMVMRQ